MAGFRIMSGARSVPERQPGPESWRLRPLLPMRWVITALVVAVVLAGSAQRTEIDRMLAMSAAAVGELVGLAERSAVGEGLGRVFTELFPPQLSRTRPVARIEGFDPESLPWLARVETRQVTTQRLDDRTLKMETVTREQRVLVEPLGYLWSVLLLMLQTIEIALWGTILAVLLALPLATLGARNYAPLRVLYFLSRGASSMLRAIPELISALFLVLAFGFGPTAGVLALGLHTAGFLGKFFAEDIENADPGPQRALEAAGASRLMRLRYAVLPQVMPSYLAYTQYILERNIRSATVIGIVGAGGIGQELKGRFEMFDFGHVGTILLVIFATVVALEYLTGRVRGRLMGPATGT